MELTNKDIQAFYGCCKSTAVARIREIKNGLKLPSDKKRILMIHLAKYEGLTVDECKQVIKLMTTPKRA
ncbi:hypothetical protein [Carboxylicivirga sp. M1479]|uniref:hypothetical protein n=1 Tax=Carboxylicivirga sp. M1479 TaxID=2594476 RepID=UPI001178821F|nr:hypothetical protein [Carboxylicivirga sp. M1479]TRX70529.1 hypothetical protein FNN09_11160 [Carboxylicivirga sp. M1479]